MDWSDESANAIGSEYIIMQHARGVQLHQRWPAMSLEQQLQCTGAIVRYMKQVADINFQAYGSLYLAEIGIDPTLKQSFAPGYIIGPHCGAAYWDCELNEPRYYSLANPNRGPCKQTSPITSV